MSVGIAHYSVCATVDKLPANGLCHCGARSPMSCVRVRELWFGSIFGGQLACMSLGKEEVIKGDDVVSIPTRCSTPADAICVTWRSSGT